MKGKCYVCGAPVLENESYDGSADFKVTTEMILAAARVMAGWWSGAAPTGIEGFWPYAEAVLRAALEDQEEAA